MRTGRSVRPQGAGLHGGCPRACGGEPLRQRRPGDPSSVRATARSSTSRCSGGKSAPGRTTWATTSGCRWTRVAGVRLSSMRARRGDRDRGLQLAQHRPTRYRSGEGVLLLSFPRSREIEASRVKIAVTGARRFPGMAPSMPAEGAARHTKSCRSVDPDFAHLPIRSTASTRSFTSPASTAAETTRSSKEHRVAEAVVVQFATGRQPRLVFANSIHAGNTTPLWRWQGSGRRFWPLRRRSRTSSSSMCPPEPLRRARPTVLQLLRGHFQPRDRCRSSTRGQRRRGAAAACASRRPVIDGCPRRSIEVGIARLGEPRSVSEVSISSHAW